MLCLQAFLPLRPVLEEMVTHPGREILSADQAAVVLGLSLLMNTPAAIRRAIQHDVAQGAKTAALCEQIFHRLRARQSHTLAKKLGTMALVGFDDPAWLKGYDDHRMLTGRAAQLLTLFDRVIDFNPARQQPRLRLHDLQNSPHAGRCALVITGNALNQPQTFQAQDKLWEASLALLQPGGYAVHMLAYSADGYDDIHRKLTSLPRHIHLHATLRASRHTGRRGNWHFIILARQKHPTKPSHPSPPPPQEQ
ncbi:MAG: hypothetical protein EBZ69_04845 [Alphaproteobacteria bacterium]|nr:hypothetical protein [Alphaproteobacteria bacterium]NDC56124.1 hypothetical protein [Alphaproteobacteria bacterium]